MKHCGLKEDRRPNTLAVIFSAKITKKIYAISTYNQNKKAEIYQWRDYLEGLKTYISNPVIAYDYTNRYKRLPNGGIYNNDFKYGVGYTIITDNSTNLPCVFVFMLNLKPEEFGLKVPPMMEGKRQNKKVYRLTESQLRSIITETIKKILLPA